MVLKHRDKELLRFEWIDDVRVSIISVNDAERRFLPLEFGEMRLTASADALRYPLEDWLLGWLEFPYELTAEVMQSLNVLRKFRFKKHRHYNWPEARLKVMTGFLQKRVSEICSFGREADKKSEQSLVTSSINPQKNVGVKFSSPSILNSSEQKAAMLILRNSSVKEESLANQLGVTIRQVERIIAALKVKAGLKRRGSDKSGEWYF